ncbi:uncharacterized protein LOC106655011 [Trichogramma pretiosum]|uniref:uncharacterized protein LOC106655011 n=1 Tax=Trichogramma pretiosum TaxID=7493 RepID=UPI0006C953EB|nr:uncharacterized protein LOC106655011 [Trichogramma pretiosum]
MPIAEDRAYDEAVASDPSFPKALDRVRRDLACIRDTPLIPRDLIDTIVWNPASAAGLGYKGKKKDNYDLAKVNALRALKDFTLYRNNYQFVPDKAFSRTQLALRSNPKLRHVWGRAFHHILIEGMVAQPLISRLLAEDTPIYMGRDMHKQMPTDIHLLIQVGFTAFCLDFSKFDASVNSFLVETAWDIIRELISFKDLSDHDVFDFCRTLFCKTPIVMPDGRLYYVTSGIPSGSYFTQMIDSIVNMLLIYMLLDHYNHLDTTTIKVLGDDSIFALSSMLFGFDDAKDYFASFGMKLSDKTLTSNDFRSITFLGHNFYGSRVTRDEFTCLSLALYSEHEMPTIMDTLIRIASLIYDCGFNDMSLHRIYRILLHEHKIDFVNVRPVTIQPPFYTLYCIS